MCYFRQCQPIYIVTISISRKFIPNVSLLEPSMVKEYHWTLGQQRHYTIQVSKLTPLSPTVGVTTGANDPFGTTATSSKTSPTVVAIP